MDTFLIEEANKDYVTRHLVFTSSVVENYWDNLTLKSWFMKRIILFDKMLTAFLHISKF